MQERHALALVKWHYRLPLPDWSFSAVDGVHQPYSITCLPKFKTLLLYSVVDLSYSNIAVCPILPVPDCASPVYDHIRGTVTFKCLSGCTPSGENTPLYCDYHSLEFRGSTTFACNRQGRVETV